MLMWAIVFGAECLLIILGNAFTIAVFWKIRLSLKRTRYLLINLSCADLMVGFAAIDVVATSALELDYDVWGKHAVVNVFFGSASIIFLLQISLERLFAIAWPFRHRATTAKAYVLFIAIGWGLSVLLASTYLISVFSPTTISFEIYSWILASFVILFLIVICCVYFVIWIHCRKQTPVLPQSNEVRNKHLAKTIFIVTLLSVLTWFPIGLSILFPHALKQGNSISNWVYFVGRCLQLANSFLNPIVYCFRMPEFRQTVKRIFIKRVTPAISTEGENNFPPYNASIVSRTQPSTIDNT